MSTLPSVSTVSNPSTWVSEFQADMAQLEREITSRRDDANIELDADEDRQAELECIGCHEQTEGASILGKRVQICPACLSQFVERESRPKLPALQPITAEVQMPNMALWNAYAR